MRNHFIMRRNPDFYAMLRPFFVSHFSQASDTRTGLTAGRLLIFKHSSFEIAILEENISDKRKLYTLLSQANQQQSEYVACFGEKYAYYVPTRTTTGRAIQHIHRTHVLDHAINSIDTFISNQATQVLKTV